MVDEYFFGTHSNTLSDDKTIENNLEHSIAEFLLSKIGQLTSSSLEFISTKSALSKFSDSNQFLCGFWQIYYKLQSYWFQLVDLIQHR